jgi:hypothetical protein
MPVRSGQGPEISSGVTTHIEAATAVAPVDDAAALEVELALARESEQPARSTNPAVPDESPLRRAASSMQGRSLCYDEVSSR